MAIPTARLATMDSAVVRRRTMSSGTTGSAARDSTNTVSANRTSDPPTMAAVCQEIQAKDPSTNEIQISSRLTPAAMSPAPR